MVWMADSVAASFQEKCVWASHIPGIKVAPPASITVAAPPLTEPPERLTRLIRLPSTSTLPRKGEALVLPSRTRTLVNSVLSIVVSSSGPAGHFAARIAAQRRRAMERAIIHHGQDAALVLQHGDVFQRIPVHQQDVRKVALAALADLALHLHDGRAPRGGGEQR